MTVEGLKHYGDYGFPPDYSDLVPLAGDSAALVDHANLLLQRFDVGGDSRRRF